MKSGIWQAAIAAIGGALLVGLGPALWKWVFEKKPSIEYKVLVYNGASEKPPPIARATVVLTIPGTEPVELEHETSPEGVATFPLRHTQGGKAAEVRIKSAGFKEQAEDRQDSGVVRTGAYLPGTTDTACVPNSSANR